MRTNYPEAMVSFAVMQRNRGKKWRDIRSEMAGHFKGKVPGERRMRQWAKAWEDDYKLGDTLARLEQKVAAINEAFPDLAGMAILGEAVDQMKPVIEALRQGKDPALVAGAGVLSRLEQLAGPRAFEAIVSEYMRARATHGSVA